MNIVKSMNIVFTGYKINRDIPCIPIHWENRKI